MIPERLIARLLQNRLRQNGIFIHNALARTACGHVLDLLIEMLPRDAAQLLRKHRQTDVDRSRTLDVLGRTYDGPALRAAREGLQLPSRLTDDETAAMHLMIQVARQRRDRAAMSALAKTLKSLRD